jgi:hypothetical protein
MAELIPNAYNSDLPNYWKDLSGIDYNVKINDTFYGKTQHYFATSSYENFKLLSNYSWNLGDPCGEGILGDLSVTLNNFFTLLRGIQQYSNVYIVGSINMIQNIAGEITKVSEAIASILKTLIQRIRNWILNKIRELIDKALESFLTPRTKQIKEGVLQTLIEQLACSFDDIIDGLVDFAGDFLYSLVGQIIQTPLCAVQNYLNAMMNRLSLEIEESIQPFLNQLGDVLGGVINIVGQVNGIIDQILGYEAFFCARPECPEVKNFKASIWGGPEPSAIANFQNFTASASGFVDAQQTKAEDWLAEFFGPNSNTSQSPGDCYTGVFKCGIPQVVIFGGGGSGAAANAVVNQIGEVIGVNLLNGGSDYTSPPFVSIVDPGGCGINASALAVLCPKPSSSKKSKKIVGYNGPGVYLNLINSTNSTAVTGWNGPGIYLDLTSATPIDSAGTVVVTFTLTKEAAFIYSVNIPGTTISGAKIPPLPYPSTNNVPVQISMNLKSGEVYGPIVKTGDPGTLYVGDQVVSGVNNSGSLPNTSIVVENGGDDWNDYVISTNEGFFASYVTPPTAPTTTTSTAPINVLFTTTGSETGYAVNLPVSKTKNETLTGPGFSGNKVQRLVNLVPGKIYGPLSVSSGSGALYIGNEKVNKILTSGSLPNTSIVVENGGDDWNDYILSTSHGFFERFTTSPNSKKSLPPKKKGKSICNINVINPGNNYSSATATATSGSPVIQIFTGSPNPVDTNNTITLNWSIVNATSASLNVSGFNNIPLIGSASVLVNPTFPSGKKQTTVTYTITAVKNEQNSAPQIVTKDFILTVNDPVKGSLIPTSPPVINTNTPTINNFTANPTNVTVGQIVKLDWDTTDAIDCSLSATGFKNPLTGYTSIPADGSLSFVMPVDIPFPSSGNATIEYELTANNPYSSGPKTTNQKVSISVSPLPAPPPAPPAPAPPAPAPPAPPAPIAGAFNCVPSTFFPNEGDTVNFTVTSTDPADVGIFYYEIISLFGSVTDSDFTDNTLTGSFTINNISPGNNSGTFSKTISKDALTEVSEQFNVLIKRIPNVPALVATSGGITITDTSLSQLPPVQILPSPGKFICTPSKTVVSEGDIIDFEVKVSDPADNGSYFYEIIGLFGSVTASDFTDNSLTGNFVISNNVGTFSKIISADLTTERQEEFYVKIKKDLLKPDYVVSSVSITINDTSIGTPAVAVINTVTPINPGNNYPPNTTITAGGGSILTPVISPNGSIVAVNVINPGYGFTRVPEIEINNREGLGAKFRVNLDFIPLDQFLKENNLKSIDPAKLVRIIDCVSR